MTYFSKYFYIRKMLPLLIFYIKTDIRKKSKPISPLKCKGIEIMDGDNVWQKLMMMNKTKKDVIY